MHGGQALAAEAEDTAILRLRRNSQGQSRALRRGHHRFPTEHARVELDRYVHVHVGFLDLEEGMRFDVDDQVEVAVASAVVAGATLAGQADARALTHARRDAGLDTACVPLVGVLQHARCALHGLLERDLDLLLDILARHLHSPAPATRAARPRAAAKRLVEEIRERRAFAEEIG